MALTDTAVRQARPAGQDCTLRDSDTELRACDHGPYGRMRILPAIFAYAGQVAFDVPQILEASRAGP